MTTPPARRPVRAVALGLPLLLLAGCGFKGAASFPLPGGVATGGDAYEVTVEFPDVLDLVPQSAVKVNDVTVGSVSDISLRDYTAIVKVKVKNDVKLPGNTTAQLRQSSLLGEKFVSLDAPPAGQATGTLRGGDVIPLARTTRNASVEEVLSALSLVLNGGSLEQLQVINREVVNALKGRETDVKDLLTQLNSFVGGLDKQKADIVRALNSLDRLTKRLADQRGVLATALNDIPRGTRVLSDQRTQLTQLVQGLSRLGDVSTRVIKASQQNTVADLRAIEPILSGLNAAGSSLPRSLELLTTYPFPRTVDQGIRGDYANLYITLDGGSVFSSQAQPSSPVGGGSLPGGIPGLAKRAPTTKAPATEAPATKSPAAPEVPALPQPAVPAVPAPKVDVPALPGSGSAPSPTAGTSSDQSLTDLLMGGNG